MKLLHKFTPVKNISFYQTHLYPILLVIFSAIATSTLVACGTQNEVEIKSDVVLTDTTKYTTINQADIRDYKKFYKPQEFKSMDMLRSDSKWSFARYKQSEHFFIFWAPEFGKDPNASSVPEAMRIDVDDMLKKAESFYAMNINTLKFAETGKGKSNLDKYKMEIYLLYQTEWLATGSGYDDVIGALWVNPSTCKPVGSVIAHEIGHCFQYQVYADALLNGATNDFSSGFRYGFGGNGGNAFWEQTAQWQSYQSYPAEAFESYNFGEYMNNYHRHILHEWQRYASFFIHYYLADKYGIDYIARIWKESKSPEDPLQTHMRLQGLTTDQLNAQLYEMATKMVTWDLDAIRTTGAAYIGKHTYKFYTASDGAYQVAYSKCPGTTGYNVVPLNVPAAGTVVTATFTALTPGSSLASGDPGQYTEDGKTLTTTKYNASSLTRAGWRYGYVALLSNGQRVYGDMNRKTSGDATFTVPSGCERLWFVVLGAPSSYSVQPWNEKESDDDQWPYKVKFTNTDVLGNITINPGDSPKDLSLTYNLTFAADASAYSGTTVNLNTNGDIAKVAQALVMQPSAIAAALMNAKATPADGKIAFAAVESSGALNYNTTANGYGFWYDSSGNVIGWGSTNDSKLFMEFISSNFEFNIGQYPGKCESGDKYSIKQAFVYTKDTKQYQVTFIFNVTIK